MEIVLSSKFMAHWDCSKTFQGIVFLHENGGKEHVNSRTYLDLLSKHRKDPQS